ARCFAASRAWLDRRAAVSGSLATFTRGPEFRGDPRTDLTTMMAGPKDASERPMPVTGDGIRHQSARFLYRSYRTARRFFSARPPDILSHIFFGLREPASTQTGTNRVIIHVMLG